MRVLFINSVCGIHSTGRICADLSRELEAQGHECKIAYGRMEEVPELAPVIYSAADVNVIPLEKEIYKTALPSKTATCLACQKPIIFAIGEESKFGRWMEEKNGCALIDSNDGAGLCEKIKELQATDQVYNAGVLPGTFFQNRKQQKICSFDCGEGHMKQQ